MSFLKTETIDINGQPLLLTELSGLDRFEHIEYCAGLEEKAPQKPDELPDDATEQQMEAHNLAIMRWCSLWEKLSFESQVNIVAYGVRFNECLDGIDTQEARRQWVWANLSTKMIKKIHNALARLCEMAVEPQYVGDEKAPEPEEPIDPKA